jgi:hypothetical protein
VELLNSRVVIEVGLDEIPSTLGGDSAMPHLPIMEMNPFHVIFYFNKFLITTRFDKGKYGKTASCTVIFHPGLKEFMEKCLVQFHVYICFITQRHNIYNYLDQI